MSAEELELLKKSEDYHNQAMDLAYPAMISLKKGETAEASRLYSEAFEIEREAAMLYLNLNSEEHKLWRSVLFRSAAWLAHNAERYREAIHTAAIGLSHDPHKMIEGELLEVLEATIAKMKVGKQKAKAGRRKKETAVAA